MKYSAMPAELPSETRIQLEFQQLRRREEEKSIRVLRQFKTYGRVRPPTTLDVSALIVAHLCYYVLRDPHTAASDPPVLVDRVPRTSTWSQDAMIAIIPPYIKSFMRRLSKAKTMQKTRLLLADRRRISRSQVRVPSCCARCNVRMMTKQSSDIKDFIIARTGNCLNFFLLRKYRP